MPRPGSVYTAKDALVSSDLSHLRLWPVERTGLNLPSDVKTPDIKKNERLYKVVIIQDVDESKKDLTCDIYQESALTAKH